MAFPRKIQRLPHGRDKENRANFREERIIRHQSPPALHSFPVAQTVRTLNRIPMREAFLNIPDNFLPRLFPFRGNENIIRGHVKQSLKDNVGVKPLNELYKEVQ